MKIGSIGYNYQHKEEFVMERPNGTGCRLMLLIKEPSIFVINGTEYKVKKNSFVMFSPSTSYKYYADGEVYTDDWIYFDLEPGNEEKFRELEILSDQIVYLSKLEELSQILHFMTYEHYSTENRHDEIEQLYTEIFLRKLSRQIRSKPAHSQVVADKNTRFIQLRSKIYTMPEEIANVNQLADELEMSRSGFQHTYKKIFGVNVMNDIINERMERAKQLLLSTDLSIKDIAQKCCYASEYSFMRLFKKHFGKTPTEFRKMI